MDPFPLYRNVLDKGNVIFVKTALIVMLILAGYFSATMPIITRGNIIMMARLLTTSVMKYAASYMILCAFIFVSIFFLIILDALCIW